MLLKFINILRSAFFRKNWKIGVIKISKKKFINLKNLEVIEKNYKEVFVENNNNYIFFADPFPLNSKLVLAEGMNNKNIGELVLINIDKAKIIKKFTQFKKHISFPFLFFEKKKIFLIPEISHWSNQKIYQLNPKNNKIFKVKSFKAIPSNQLKDPVIYKKNKNYYLFYSLKNSKGIKIASSKHLFGQFKKIKNNTISKLKSGVRMAGAVININSDCYRISQNNTFLYGDGVKINKILYLDQENYKEKYLRTLKFDKVYGPHTISFIGNNLFFDYYTLKFDLSHFANKLKAQIFT